MKKLLPTIILSLILPFTVLSQSCLPEGITFTTQTQIDSFQVNNPNCTEVEGDVGIQGDNITNLDGLSVLTAIVGNLNIGYIDGGNPALTSLTGLDNVTSIGGELGIWRNYTMTSLTGLENLTSIGGELYIHSNLTLTSLTGLNNLIFIGGNVDIWDNGILTSLVGLENLTSIGGNLIVQFNIAMTSLMGLESLTTIDGDLIVYICEDLTSLTGLENLTSIGGELEIYHNISLTNLTGLVSLTSIGGNLNINGNGVLTSLDGLENLTSIGGELLIKWNDALTNLDGLQSLEPGFVSNLSIIGNNSLSTCEVECICNYLANPNGVVTIYNNADGCNNPSEIANACGFTIPCLPYGNYYFLSQSDVDDFQTNFPGCTELEGGVRISGDDITSLNGLNVVTSIGGYLEIPFNLNLKNLIGLDNLSYIGGDLGIGGNDSLTSFSGLESLTIIDGMLSLGGLAYGNPSLTNITGLDNLSSVGGLAIMSNETLNSLSGLENISIINGNLIIGGNPALTDLLGLHNVTSIEGMLWVVDNESLVNLSGLDNVASIGGWLSIGYNEALTSLSGLDNIDASSIDSLRINNNISLSTCEVKSVCDYIDAPNGDVEIHDNAPGCNIVEEVEEACASSVHEIGAISTLTVSPNPFTSITALSYDLKQPETVQLSIYNQLGQLVYQHSEDQQQGSQQLHWKADDQPEGLYYCRLQAGDRAATGKLVKVK